jgi:hypothetical protein
MTSLKGRMEPSMYKSKSFTKMFAVKELGDPIEQRKNMRLVGA